MNKDIYLFLICLFGIPTIISTIFGLLSFTDKKKREKELKELNDCPFKFDTSDYGEVSFDLGSAILCCDYSLGIRKDGIYGIKKLLLRGINNRNDRIKLDLGQSIFPIILKMKTFEQWYETKTFETNWDNSFLFNWEDTIKQLDNLSYLEDKYDERNNG